MGYLGGGKTDKGHASGFHPGRQLLVIHGV
jgi:hypothetical protein